MTDKHRLILNTILFWPVILLFLIAWLCVAIPVVVLAR